MSHSAPSWVLINVAVCVACAPGSLLDVPIRGEATGAQRAAIEEELLRFESWVGGGRVHVGTIRFRDEVKGDPGIHGYWSPNSRTISLQSSVDGQDLIRVLRHELCHALDSVENHSLGDLYGQMGDAIPLADATRARRAREAFADVCEGGPVEASLLLANRCVHDSDVVRQATRLALDAVWTQFVSDAEAPPLPPWVAAYRPDRPVDVVDWKLSPLEGDAGLDLKLTYDDRDVSVSLDPRTGNVITALKTPIADDTQGRPPAPAGSVWHAHPYGGSPEGPAVAVVEVDGPRGHPPWQRRLLVYEKDGPWLAVPDGCRLVDASQRFSIWTFEAGTRWYGSEREGWIGWTEL